MNYWAKRQAQVQEALTDKSIAETEKQLIKYYKRAMKKIIGQFEQTYNKVLLSMSEEKEPTPADLYKLDKYWQMQAQLKEELQKLGDNSMAAMSNKFVKEFNGIYAATAIKGKEEFNKISKETANQMINQVWCADGKSWSQRVWINTDKLQQSLNDELIHCLLTGKNPAHLKKKLMDDFNVSFRRADTLVRTEMAHIQSEAAKQRYADYGIKEVEILVEPDGCEECQKLKGKRFPTFGTMPVPAHPNCRCCVVPVID